MRRMIVRHEMSNGLSNRPRMSGFQTLLPLTSQVKQEGRGYGATHIHHVKEVPNEEVLCPINSQSMRWWNKRTRDSSDQKVAQG